MRRAFAGACATFLFLGSTSSALAQSACKSLSDDRERLACYDKANAATPTPTPAATDSGPTPHAAETPPPAWLSRIQIRDQGTVNNAGSDPASFSVSRNKGQDATLAKVALIWLAPFATDYGWQPFASVAINRNTLTSSATDVHSGNIGVSGAIFDFSNGFSIWSTLSGSAREDVRKDTASNTATFDNYLAIRSFVSPAIDDSAAFAFFPRFGLQYEDDYRVASNMSPGSYRGGFIGGRGTYTPGHLDGRVQLSALFQRYRDFSASSEVVKRSNAYSKLSLDYYLFDPSDKNAWLQPVIGLSHEVGSDPLSGSLRNNLTSLALKLKMN